MYIVQLLAGCFYTWSFLLPSYTTMPYNKRFHLLFPVSATISTNKTATSMVMFFNQMCCSDASLCTVGFQNHLKILHFLMAKLRKGNYKNNSIFFFQVYLKIIYMHYFFFSFLRALQIPTPSQNYLRFHSNNSCIISDDGTFMELGQHNRRHHMQN